MLFLQCIPLLGDTRSRTGRHSNLPRTCRSGKQWVAHCCSHCRSGPLGILLPPHTRCLPPCRCVWPSRRPLNKSLRDTGNMTRHLRMLRTRLCDTHPTRRPTIQRSAMNREWILPRQNGSRKPHPRRRSKTSQAWSASSWRCGVFLVEVVG